MRGTITNIMLFVIFVFLLLPGVQSASAGDQDQERYLYQWTDERGNAHISDSLEKVPAKHRAKAARIGQGVSGGTESPQTEAPVREEPRGFSLTDDAASQDEDSQKMEWQQRMYDARQRLTEAEQRLERSAAQLKILQEKKGYGLYGYPPESAGEAARLEEEISRAQVDMNRARDEVENVIPEQARRAGVPPGWLREVR